MRGLAYDERRRKISGKYEPRMDANKNSRKAAKTQREDRQTADRLSVVRLTPDYGEQAADLSRWGWGPE
jgi:hypothetical protein